MAATLVGLTPAGPRAQQGQQPPQPAPVFRSSVDLVLVDVVVRDRTGAVVKGLTASDFELFEDGVRQEIRTFAYEEIGTAAPAVERPPALLSAATGLGSRASGPADREPKPLSAEDVAGHRLLVIVFDTSSMQPEDVQRAAQSAIEWVDRQMSPADLVAVAAIGSTLDVLTDFTSNPEQVRSALASFSGAESTAFGAVDASTTATDEAVASATDDSAAPDAGMQELDTFNNDVRLRALRTLAEALAPLQQKKAIVYFSAGMQRNGVDNQIELRAAVNAAVRANVAIYPVDARGLQAIVPGGSARQASRSGIGAFSGRNVAAQFSDLAAQQETLTALAADTGGTAFTDTNDFGEAFARVVRDISSYYVLGFASSNPVKDGRFRRITVRVRGRSGVRVEAREGYYAERDFAHTGRADRDAQLQEQLAAQLAATDVPLIVAAGWFRVGADRYYVPVSLAVPGSAVPSSDGRLTLDVAGVIRDERGFPVGRIRDTITVPPAAAGTLAARQVVYHTGVTLPPGRFSVKVVVRENATGRMGAFEAPVVVPELKSAPVKVSSVVLSTQMVPAASRRSASPLARGGVELVPNLTHVVRRDQKLYFYYEVYEPAMEGGSPHIRTSLAFYRGAIKVLETPLVERTAIDAADRRAAVFQFEVAAEKLERGLYTCQVNIIDEVAGRFAFPRLQLYVR